MGGPNLPPCQNGSTLTSDHGRAWPTTMSEWICTYIWPWEDLPTTMWEWICTYIWPWEDPPTTMSKGLHTYIWTWEDPPSTMSEGIMDSSLPLGRNLDLENTKLVPEVFKLHPSHWLSQHISYLSIRHNILELHCSSLHHFPDIVIFDLQLDATCIY